MFDWKEELTSIDYNDRNCLIGFSLASLISGCIGVYLCNNIPKPENLSVMWQYFHTHGNLYLTNYFSVILSIAFSYLFLYRIYTILKKHAIESYGTNMNHGVTLNLVSILLIGIYALISIGLMVYFIKYLFLLLLVPLIALAIAYAIFSDK